MSDELDIMWRRYAALRGEHTCEEIINTICGVYKLNELDLELNEQMFVYDNIHALSLALPQLSVVEAHRAINSILSSVNYSKSLRRIVREERAKKRERRQHRAAFRRRKRGLA